MCRSDDTPSVHIVCIYTLQKAYVFDLQLDSYYQGVKGLTTGHSTLLLDQILLYRAFCSERRRKMSHSFSQAK